MKFILKYLLSLSIYTKLAIAIVFMVIFIFASTILVSINLSNEQTNKISNEFIQSSIDANKEFITRVILEKDYWNLYKYIKALSKNSLISEIGVVDNNNNILVYSNPKKYKSGNTITNNLKEYKTMPIISNDTFLGTIILIEDETNLNTIIKNTFINSFYFIVVIALLSLIFANLFLRRIMNRFQIVIDNMENISNKRWNNIKRENTLEQDELHALIVQSVQIVDEIKDSIQKESDLRIFYHNVLSSIDSFIIISDKKFNIRYHNNHLLSSYLLDLSKTIFQDNILTLLEQNRNTSFIIDIKTTKDMYLLFSISNIEDRLLINVSDITKLREAEENDKILQSLETIKEISSQFAHEIKNLLQPLTLLLPKDKIPDSEDLPIINMTLAKMKQQVSDYLVIGRSVTVLDEDKSYPYEIIQDLIKILEAKLNEKNLTININIQNELCVPLNSKYVELILMNLLTNAIEASFEKTLIELTWTNESKKETKLTIKNIGEEIKDTSQIFKPFFTTKKEGSGLGLFSIYKIVYTVQGKIDVTSQNNETIFNIYLPIKDKT